MKLRTLAVLFSAVLALSACRNREAASITGSYGSNTLTGEVVMTDSGSPAGVEVTVRGTGMTSVLGPDGRFAFASVPESADLDFTRSSDGVAASLKLDQPSGHFVIELTKTTAKKSSRRRGASGGARLYEFEGVVRSATDAQVVVYTSKKEEVTIALTPTTIIRKGNQILTAADLLVDTRIHVKAQKLDTGFSAVVIMVQNAGEDDGDDTEEPKPAAKEFEGLVRTATADQLVIFSSHGVEETFILTADTVIRKGNTPIAATDIKPDWRVHVRATTAADGSKTATLVIVQNTNSGHDDGDDDDSTEVEVAGVVSAVGASDLTVLAGGRTVTVQTDASTRLEKKGHAITLADIHAGDKVKAEGTAVDATTILAKEIEVKSK